VNRSTVLRMAPRVLLAIGVAVALGAWAFVLFAPASVADFEPFGDEPTSSAEPAADGANTILLSSAGLPLAIGGGIVILVGAVLTVAVVLRRRHAGD
jgi:hypothetical protein